MKTLEKLDFAKLWNSEHPRVYNRLITIAEKHNPADLHLTGAVTRAKAHLPELEKIEAIERGSMLSKQLQALDNRRDNLIWAITGLTQSLATADMPDTRDHVQRVAAFLAKHDARSIPQANYTSESERIDDMLADAERNPELQASIAALNMGVYVTELTQVNSEFEMLFMQRTGEGASAISVDSKAIRTEADKDMRRLFRFIELYQLEYPDVDYLPLVRELNQLLNYYKTQLAARATRRKSGVDTDTEQPIPEPEAV